MMEGLHDEVSEAIRDGDVNALAQVMFSLRDQVTLLVRIQDEVARATAINAALARLQDIWFIVFKYAQPRELVAAYEYDFLVRHSEPDTERTVARALMMEAVDRALLVKYFPPYGVVVYRSSDPPLYGAQLMLKARPSDSVEALLTGGGDDAELAFDDALLNPPWRRVAEWTVFHVRMRHLTFMMLDVLMAYFEKSAQSQALLRWLLRYADRLHTLMWRDRAQNVASLEEVGEVVRANTRHTLLLGVEAFFRPETDDLQQLMDEGETVDWHVFIHEHWHHVESQVAPGVDNDAFFLATLQDAEADAACLIPKDGRYDFVYRPSAEAQAAFFLRVATALAS